MRFARWVARIAALMIVVMLSGPARAEWRRAESPHFVLYGEQSERALRERILLLEEFDRLLRMMTNINEPPSPNRLHIYLLGNARELSSVRAVPSSVAGFYTATTEGIGAFIDNTATGGNQLLFHEYAHHFMLQHRPFAYPAWYVEGFAEYYMTVRFNPPNIQVGDASAYRAAFVIHGRWLPMLQILRGPDRRLSEEERGQFYAQSWLLTHFFYSTAERRSALTNYLSAAQRGDPAAALHGALGLTPDQLERELRRYVGDRRIPGVRITESAPRTPPAVTVTVLSRGADSVMADAATLRIGVGENYRPPLLARLRAAIGRFPNDPFVQRTLAHAEALYGDGAAAERLLQPLIAASPNDAELMYLMGRRYLAAAETENPPPDARRTAREWFGRAHRADGNHYQTLYRYAQSQVGGRNFDSENTMNILLLANRLAPQVSEIAMNMAPLLIRRGRREDAVRVLEPLANNAHDSGLARTAARLLAEARGERPPPDSEADQPQEPR